MEHCRLANLPDLDQDNAFVRSKLLEWVASLQGLYDFDGLRIGNPNLYSFIYLYNMSMILMLLFRYDPRGSS